MSDEFDCSPDFLVIGAQKSGTTTLWEDLRAHPAITMADKESNGLLDPRVLTPEGMRYYSALFDSDGSTKGEVCTTYAMLPTHEGVAERARTLNPATRVIYIVRDPVARVISHHHHEVAAQTMSADIDDAVRKHDRLIDHSRYAYQLRPWLDAFGPERVHIVQFERYMADRVTGASHLYSLLGLADFKLPDPESVHNAATDKRVGVGIGGRVANHPLYRKAIRPRIPTLVKGAAKRVLLRKAPPRPAPPSRETLETLVRTLSPEVRQLAFVVGEEPWWDLEARWLA